MTTTDSLESVVVASVFDWLVVGTFPENFPEKRPNSMHADIKNGKTPVAKTGLWIVFVVLAMFGVRWLRIHSPPYEVSETVSADKQLFVSEKYGRKFSKPSIHPNSEEWIFSECTIEINSDGECHLLKYNTSNNSLYRFVLPEGYRYAHAEFSPTGNYIVLDRRPNFGKIAGEYSLKNDQQSAENYQIVIMRSDGTCFEILPIPKGRNLGPIMSIDESKIAYWRRTPWKGERYVGDWSDGEIFEFDLKSKKSNMFAGPFQFSSGAMSRYITDDEILLQTYATKHPLIQHGANKKFNRSEVFILKRGTSQFPDPSFTSVEGAGNPSVDQEGNVYLRGQDPRYGSSFFKVYPLGEKQFWQIPHGSISNGRTPVVLPNGRKIVFMYSSDDSNSGNEKSAFGVLDMETSSWFPVDIPPIQSSIPVAVRPMVQ
ncbi:MAG: hypothetical protein H7836_14840 [Magnetococcus sp. YQC-3]